MATLMEPIVDSLLSSFRKIPPAAIPAMLDCILASTNAAPSSIFSTLLNEFPTFSKGIVDGSKHLDFEQRNCVVSFVSAICHLLKKSEKWVPIIEVPVSSTKVFLEKKKQEGFSILGLEQTANSISLDRYAFPKRTVLLLGREKEGIPVDIIHILDACIEIPQLGVVRSLNVHVSGAIALWEYTRQQRSSSC